MPFDLIDFCNHLSYLRKTFSDVKERFIIRLIQMFNEDQAGYKKKYKELLETETNDEIYKMLDLLESVIKSYAYQMQHQALTSRIMFTFDKYFGAYK
jgi:hypothetical protein